MKREKEQILRMGDTFKPASSNVRSRRVHSASRKFFSQQHSSHSKVLGHFRSFSEHCWCVIMMMLFTACVFVACLLMSVSSLVQHLHTSLLLLPLFVEGDEGRVVLQKATTSIRGDEQRCFGRDTNMLVYAALLALVVAYFLFL